MRQAFMETEEGKYAFMVFAGTWVLVAAILFAAYLLWWIFISPKDWGERPESFLVFLSIFVWPVILLYYLIAIPSYAIRDARIRRQENG